MKNNSTTEITKNTIRGDRVSRESIYYTSLFGVALITAIVLLIISIARHNKSLTIYASLIGALFLIATLVAVRCICMSKNTLHTVGDTLVIKRFFVTRKFKSDKINKLTIVKFGDKGLNKVNITYGEKTFRYKFYNLSKEEISKLRASAK